jgi:chromosome segregation ATPase
MFEPEASTLDTFMADGKEKILESTLERLRLCKLAQDMVNDVHKATREKLETVYAHAKRLEGQFATVKARSDRQGRQISAYENEVTRRDERITKLEADLRRARQNVQKVFDTLDYVEANFNRVVQFGDSEAGDGAA